MTKKGFWLDSLLRLYAWATLAVLSLVAFLVSFSIWSMQEAEAKRVAQLVMTRTQDVVDYTTQVSQQVALALSDNPAKLEGIYKYFSLTPSQYASWRLNHPLRDLLQLSLHENIDDLYRQFDFVDGIAISLTDYQKVYLSTRGDRSGQQVAAADFHAGAKSIPITIYDSNNGQVAGTVFVTINEQILRTAVEAVSSDLPVRVTVRSPYDQELFVLTQGGEKRSDTLLESRTVYDYRIQVSYSKVRLFQGTLKWIFLIFIAGVVLTIGLYYLLRKVFGRYYAQVADLVQRIQDIGLGQGHLRIQEENKEGELALISQHTNLMLDRLEEQSRENYQLELSQKDAQMRALQAQINPHFLYNTLEFIRMYAVMEDQEELATLIYEFASLMRNNISEEGVTTLRQEFEFCRKYSYLCMMRYPHTVAYGYQILDGLDEFKIPKFAIQPLVENYFVHGIDHEKQDNALSVKALRNEWGVEIIIKDNGHGLSPQGLQDLRALLREKADWSGEKRRSIGISNVHERLLLYFKNRYQIELDSQEGKGLTYHIRISDD